MQLCLGWRSNYVMHWCAFAGCASLIYGIDPPASSDCNQQRIARFFKTIMHSRYTLIMHHFESNLQTPSTHFAPHKKQQTLCFCHDIYLWCILSALCTSNESGGQTTTNPIIHCQRAMDLKRYERNGVKTKMHQMPVWNIYMVFAQIRTELMQILLSCAQFCALGSCSCFSAT